MNTNTLPPVSRATSRNWLALSIWVVEAAVILVSMIIVMIRNEFQDNSAPSPQAQIS